MRVFLARTHLDGSLPSGRVALLELRRRDLDLVVRGQALSPEQEFLGPCDIRVAQGCPHHLLGAVLDRVEALAIDPNIGNVLGRIVPDHQTRLLGP